MADDMRKLQRCQIGDAVGIGWVSRSRKIKSKNRRVYGCPCCNNAPLPKLKRNTRRAAKRWLNQADQQEFAEYLQKRE
jgi:hypothetical protein